MDKLMHEKIIQQKIEELNYTTLRSPYLMAGIREKMANANKKYDEGKKKYVVYSLEIETEYYRKIRTFGNFEEAEQCLFEILV